VPTRERLRALDVEWAATEGDSLNAAASGRHLSWYDPQKRSWLELHLSEPIPLVELVRQARLPEGEIAVWWVNRRAISLEEAIVSTAIVLSCNPPLGGGT